jgi:hypothetical protein
MVKIGRDIGVKQSGSIFLVRNIEFSWGNGLDAEESAPRMK